MKKLVLNYRFAANNALKLQNSVFLLTYLYTQVGNKFKHTNLECCFLNIFLSPNQIKMTIKPSYYMRIYSYNYVHNTFILSKEWWFFFFVYISNSITMVLHMSGMLNRKFMHCFKTYQLIRLQDRAYYTSFVCSCRNANILSAQVLTDFLEKQNIPVTRHYVVHTCFSYTTWIGTLTYELFAG
jgi:hypothetical protein